MNTNQLDTEKSMVYRITSYDGKKYKVISDNLEFVKEFFSLKGAYKSVESLREATDQDFDTLNTLG